MALNIAVVGCTGMVGRKFLQVLQERNVQANYYLFASKKSAGSQIDFMGKAHTVIELAKENILDKKIDIALFSAGGSVSLEFAPIFANNGAIVIDNSSAWRMDPDVPLVVPEVNAEDILTIKKNIIANPNCSTIQAVVALKPLDDKYGIKRVVYSTYQAVSGAGVAGYEDLKNGANGEAPKKFPYPIYANCIPQIDVFLDNGYTKEEEKMINETRKILHKPDLKVTATTVRVSVFHGHSESINIELEKSCTKEDAIETFKNAKGVIVQNDDSKLLYPMPINAENHDEVYIGRIRQDFSVENGLNIWVVADNIRKGAATNAVQIAEWIIANGIVK